MEVYLWGSGRANDAVVEHYGLLLSRCQDGSELKHFTISLSSSSCSNKTCHCCRLVMSSYLLLKT